MDVTATCTELHDISPPFSIQDGREVNGSLVLPQFGTLNLPGPLGGTVAFVGGPVWALDWHDDGVHLALSASRVEQPVHRASEIYHGYGNVQIWRAGPESLELIALAPHNGDTAWDLSWRPHTTGATAMTVAAALANGQLTLFHYPTDKQPTPFHEPPLIVQLRKTNDLMDAVRVTKWSLDGSRLASGTLRGCIEIWSARKKECFAPEVVLETRVRVHDFAVSRIAWLDKFLLSSVGHDGAVRVRDIRQPDENLDNVDDGLAWNNCLIIPEPGVAIAGTDHGFLKMVKLASYDSDITAQLKRKRVQTGSIRDLACIAVPSKAARTPSKKTAIFVAGSEGVVFHGSLPRPLWTAPKSNPKKFACNSGRYLQIPFLQWTTIGSDIQQQKQASEGATENADKDKPMEDENASSSRPVVPPPTSSDTLKLRNEDLYKIKTAPLLLRLSDALWNKEIERMASRSSSKVRINVRTDVNLCADSYDQRVLISRIALSETSRLFAVTTFAGFLTVIQITDDVLNFVKPGMSRTPAQPAAAKKGRVGRPPGRKQSNPKSSVKSDNLTKPKKRGRPRKKPL